MTCLLSVFEPLARDRSPSPTASAERDLLAQCLGGSEHGLATGILEVPNDANRIAIHLFSHPLSLLLPSVRHLVPTLCPWGPVPRIGCLTRPMCCEEGPV